MLRIAHIWYQFPLLPIFQSNNHERFTLSFDVNECVLCVCVYIGGRRVDSEWGTGLRFAYWAGGYSVDMFHLVSSNLLPSWCSLCGILSIPGLGHSFLSLPQNNPLGIDLNFVSDKRTERDGTSIRFGAWVVELVCVWTSLLHINLSSGLQSLKCACVCVYMCIILNMYKYF